MFWCGSEGIYSDWGSISFLHICLLTLYLLGQNWAIFKPLFLWVLFSPPLSSLLLWLQWPKCRFLLESNRGNGSQASDLAFSAPPQGVYGDLMQPRKAGSLDLPLIFGVRVGWGHPVVYGWDRYCLEVFCLAIRPPPLVLWQRAQSLVWSFVLFCFVFLCLSVSPDGQLL